MATINSNFAVANIDMIIVCDVMQQTVHFASK